jgi:hypothetical protein
MLKFYFNGSPNPTKVALFLEEAGIAYEPIPIDTRTGDQFRADFLSVNPNGKVPAIVDGEVVVFDSNATARRSISSTSRPRKSRTATPGINSRPRGISPFSTPNSPNPVTFWGMNTRSWTWTSGAGRAWSPSSWATMPGRNSRT